ncbi:hypothetical protein C7212DRAFT_25396, partial [Tuber magnatum]
SPSNYPYQIPLACAPLDTTADRPSNPPYICEICETKFGRETDLKRHKRTTKKHSPPSGPACTEPGCKHPARFTRVDNFKHHFKKQHRKTGDEADAFIADWRAREEPGF